MKYYILACFMIGVVLNSKAAGEGTNYRYRTAKIVFDDLVAAKGVKNMPVPDFVLTKTTKKVAWSNYKELEIGLEEKAYDICASFGKDSLNALAGILAHELTHYYEKHGWIEQFIGDYTSIENDEALLANDEHLTKELQADYLGGFLAYAAGYQSLEIMPQFLEKVYFAYALKNKLEGYPTLIERIKTAKESATKCRQLIDVYNCANYLIGFGDYHFAKEYYAFILKEFQSREIYNNLGICALSAFLDLSSSKKIKYAYPFELDARSRLQNNKRGGSSNFTAQKQQKSALLIAAKSSFKTAMLLDQSYSISYLNLACAYALEGEIDDATYFLNKSIKLASENQQNKTLGDCYILKGILAAKTGAIDKANNFFNEAHNYNPILSTLNQQITSGERVLERTKKSATIESKSKEKIGALSISKCIIDLKRGRIEPDYIVDINKEIQFAILETEDSNVYIHVDQQKDEYLLIQSVHTEYLKSTQNGIGLHASFQQLLSAYPPPYNHVNFNDFIRLVYPTKGLLFDVNKENKIISWALFKKG